MIEGFIEPMIQTGILGTVCAFFMWKDVRKDNKILSALDKISIIIDERIPKQ